MERNHTMMQFFEWHVESDGNHWNRLRELAPELKKRGVDAIWIPPVTKAQSAQDTGYGVYDHYDLGEFDQKGTIRTKYGTKQQLQEAIQACQDNGLVVYVDLVMNHKAGADETEVFQVVEVDREDRLKVLSEPFDIEGWTKFTHPGRGDKYSSFKWNFGHFNGTDYDAKTNKTGIFRIVGENKAWNDRVDDGFGNYDYLMFANLDYNHPEVIREMLDWGKWLAETTHCNGYRLDAIKHIDYDFVREFVDQVKAERGDEFFIVGEYWNSDPGACQEFLEIVEHKLSLFDVTLHYQMHAASQVGKDFDMQTIFDHSLVSSNPRNAVTFVDNHDSQPNEALESWIDDWFKQIAYALILLREGGYPCVFYGDYFQIGGEEVIEGKKEAIDPLLYARYHKAYGEQEDYIDHPHIIGWVRRGAEEIERSGCAVVISNDEAGDKRMFVGAQRAGEVWTDLTNTRDEHIVIEEDGFAVFPVNGGSVSVWALPEFDL
ncbi:alpha-amylase [Paenibacillus psychroresistens]|uniref:Alpha-amylase n=1 Tax=Paenibacillus psychroresistens TaxID=1778678 RepID=A0A6B8RHA6_9BACL|nr:alpha-amylase [Paenibacillus psychroresistens]QGQ94776.1 alpha-amylase [Paenibacillus psychroresistens]